MKIIKKITKGELTLIHKRGEIFGLNKDAFLMVRERKGEKQVFPFIPHLVFETDERVKLTTNYNDEDYKKMFKKQREIILDNPAYE